MTPQQHEPVPSLKVLVATRATQGQHERDFSYVPEGELVARYGVVCDDERPGRHGCGCGWSFPGLTTHKATSTAMVVERPMTEADWRAAVHQTLHDTGFAQWMTAEELADEIDWLVALDLSSLDGLPPGTVVGRHAWRDANGLTSDQLILRRIPAPTE